MSKYKGLFTFDVENHRYLPVGQADGLIPEMDYHPEARKRNEAVRRLEDSGLFTEEEMKTAARQVVEIHINPWTHGSAAAVGWTPNKAGEILGVSGSGIQAKCKTGAIEATQVYFGWWVIPAGEMLRLREEQNARKK